MPEQDWRDFRALVGEFLRNPGLVEVIRKRTGIGQRTLERWENGKTREPARRLLSKLIDALPQDRDRLVSAIKKPLPDFTAPLIDNSKDFFEEIPSSFWRRFFEANAKVPRNIHTSTIVDMVFAQLQPFIDPDEIGVQLIVAQCNPPTSSHGPVRSLREVAQAKYHPLTEPHGDTSFLGAESLVGTSVSLCKGRVVQNVQEERLVPVRKVPGECSAAAYPIERGGDVAGCFLVSSPQSYFFSPRLQYLLQVYAYLLTDAFETDQFYPPERIRLRPMPDESIQSGIIATFQERIMAHIQRDSSLGLLRAETQVWQEIEEQLLTVALTRR